MNSLEPQDPLSELDMNAVVEKFPEASSVLEKVKKRLLQSNIDVDDEEDDLSGPSIFDFSSTQRLPQLEIDESEFADTQAVSTQKTQTVQGEGTQMTQSTINPFGDTQMVPSNNVSQIDPTQKIEELPSLSREEKIAKLIEEKRAQRLREEQELMADISHTTLTDDENEENEHSRVMTSHSREGMTKKQLEEAQKFINIQKRSQNICPEFSKEVRFTKDKLLAAFESDESENETPSKSTPPTSPLKKETQAPSQRPNPLDKYAQSLKLQKDSHIDLESDSDDDHSFQTRIQNDLPRLSKEQQLLIKQKFTKKKMQKSSNNVPKGNNFLAGLRKAHVEQLKANRVGGDPRAMEEFEKEEIMGSLLEREMERVRKIRKKEKLREKAKAALLSQGGDFEALEAEEVESVAESDYSENEESEVSGEESASESASESTQQVQEPVNQMDDSYMFGAVDDSFEHEDAMVTTSEQVSQPLKVLDQDSEGSYKLFSNLRPRSGSVLSDTQIAATQLEGQLPVFQDIMPSQEQTQADTQNKQIDTQRITQATQSTTQAHTQVTQSVTQLPPSLDDSDDEIRVTRRKTVLEDIEEREEASEPEEMDPEEAQRRIKEYEDKIRRKELKARKRRKALERKGIKNVVDGEAEESEDEWQGLGGADGDISDDQANSEDEKMIDNDFRIDLKNEDVRRKFMEDYQIKDQKELEKLLDDVKNHRLTKKVAANGFDIDLSDEEDELLAAYRKQRMAEQHERMLQSKTASEISKNDKTKAFFSSMHEDSPVVNLDNSDEEPEEEEEEEQEEEGLKRPKKTRVDESFIQKQLSFLTSTNDDDEYARVQRISNFQHGVDSDNDVDVEALKSSSISRLTSMTSSSKKHELEVDTDADDTDDDMMPAFKKPSFMGSFMSFQEQQSLQVKDGKSFSGVTISKQYRVASGSKASITYSSKLSSQQTRIKTSKEKKLERNLTLSKQHSKRLFTGSGAFES